MSVNSTNPSTLFGGTWQKIEGRFLIGVGKNTDDNNETWTIANGQAHGEYNHKLTLNEMPSHRHRGLSWWGNDAKESITLNGGSGSGYNLSYSGGNLNDQHTAIETRDAGSNWKHNNMPPYLGVYMWKRTA